MAYKKIKQPKLSDVITSQLEEMILEGSLSAGQKLPPERELAEQFSVSRPSLREAIQNLEAKGLVFRRQGGGTFVADTLLSGLSDPLFALMANKGESQFDLLEFRHGIEGMAAYYAAMRGTKEDFSNIEAKYEAITVAHIENTQLSENFRGEAQSVFEFYLAICEASHNAVILHLARAMSGLLIDNIEKNLQVLAKRPEVPARIAHYRKRLMESIISGEPNKAWGASHKNLAYIEEIMLNLAEENSRVTRSLRRLQTQ
ncbi:pyruvate dehydrogenase complex transcriptional repressor PdhR [Thalassotalea sp. HSM 43]|uniref:pyruvate dehydrogenase complex transcriptional repressor PdhR n=1 Tax=Thalassotalea sp. HSM 43 TaxID=2552945 RepID=UPI001081C301|nr:pyruvate dehydrogenase complex transcriptional repressor PdhR [Thalassotalea sp. HSM 43]QBY04845.1 pyruvate dehydrogenase complex transcriptional repressor PdhR [Thalassotalea sp. HSM 43]